MKVQFIPSRIEEKTGLDLAVHDETASVEDLLTAVQPWCADGTIYKQYLEKKSGDCAGCAVNCCRECLVVPDLISFDMLRKSLAVDSREFFASYIDQEYLKQGLPRLRSSPCVFLKDRLCSVYRSRTLICRLYICTLMTSRASDIIYSVIAAGIGEFMRFAREEGQLAEEARPPGGSYTGMLYDLVHPESIRLDNPFRGVWSYREVPLSPFLKGAGRGIMVGEKARSL